jgi:hypothetical protein
MLGILSATWSWIQKENFLKVILFSFSQAITTEEGGFEATSNSIIEKMITNHLELETSYNDVNSDFNLRRITH